ncbi:hypothetical protein Pelo_1780 [Pelomyxa schiedti]|nr:hypothetical protein Pelo_1780 [Pelomyxa schiedti]
MHKQPGVGAWQEEIVGEVPVGFQALCQNQRWIARCGTMDRIDDSLNVAVIYRLNLPDNGYDSARTKPVVFTQSRQDELLLCVDQDYKCLLFMMIDVCQTFSGTHFSVKSLDVLLKEGGSHTFITTGEIMYFIVDSNPEPPAILSSVAVEEFSGVAHQLRFHSRCDRLTASLLFMEGNPRIDELPSIYVARVRVSLWVSLSLSIQFNQ